MKSSNTTEPLPVRSNLCIKTLIMRSDIRKPKNRHILETWNMNETNLLIQGNLVFGYPKSCFVVISRSDFFQIYFSMTNLRYSNGALGKYFWMQPALTCSKLAMETLEQSAKYVQS